MPWAAVLLPCAKISRTGEHLAASHGLGWPGALGERLGRVRYSHLMYTLLLASDLNWIHVQDAEEAWKLLKVGRKNQSFASTHLNQNSSRR